MGSATASVGTGLLRERRATRAAARLLWAVPLALMPSVVAVQPATAVLPAAGCATSTAVYDAEVPWAQQRLNAAEVWPLTQGEGVLVAILSTGIDATNAQLDAGQVLPGADFSSQQGGGATDDCDGRGTFVAGIIAAELDPTTPIRGIAPGVRLLPVRVAQTLTDPDGASTEIAGGGPDQLAEGIRYAAAQGADVICVTITSATDSRGLRSAVGNAVAGGAVVVAGGTLADPAQTQQAVTYPTSYPTVLAVTATDQDGQLVDGAEQGEHIDLSAPGGTVWSTAAGTGGGLGHVGPVDDPAAATAYVAGVAAMIVAYHPELDPAGVQARLEVTADHSTAGFRAYPVGAGMLDPYAAVASHLGTQSLGTPADGTRDVVAALAQPPRMNPAERNAVQVVAVLALLLVFGVFATIALRLARARGWRPRRIAAPN